jgi:hypothetical protein
MNTLKTCMVSALLVTATIGGQRASAADAAAPGTAEAAAEPAHWQKVPVDFSYSGFTTMYSCYGIEDKVKALLIALGARADARINASGCETGPHMHVSKFAFVRGEFHVLVPGPGAAGEDTVQALWQVVAISPNRPFSMGEGDCELVEQMKPMVEKAFTLREASYRTSCVPNTLSMNGYSLKANVLRLPKQKS